MPVWPWRSLAPLWYAAWSLVYLAGSRWRVADVRDEAFEDGRAADLEHAGRNAGGSVVGGGTMHSFADCGDDDDRARRGPHHGVGGRSEGGVEKAAVAVAAEYEQLGVLRAAGKHRRRAATLDDAGDEQAWMRGASRRNRLGDDLVGESLWVGVFGRDNDIVEEVFGMPGDDSLNDAVAVGAFLGRPVQGALAGVGPVESDDDPVHGVHGEPFCEGTAQRDAVRPACAASRKAMQGQRSRRGEDLAVAASGLCRCPRYQERRWRDHRLSRRDP